MRYRIHPAGVQATLKKTAADAEDLGPLVAPLSGDVQAAATATGGSGAITPALSEFLRAQETRLTAMSTRMTSCITGAAEATKAYIKGDHEMAAEISAAQSRAVTAAGKPPR